MAEVYNCSGSEEYFCGTFENNPFKIISVIFSALSTPICILLLYGIIWFEKYGTDHKRTLANKLFSSLCWSLICALVVCSFDIIRYTFGPLPSILCFLAVIARNTVRTQIVLFYDAILVTRYVFIFRIKNPGGVDDDFWCRLLSLWIVGISALVNFVIYSLPLKRPMYFFICTDMDPQLDFSKSNKPIAIEEILSVLLLIIIKVKISLHRKKINKIDDQKNTFQKNYVLSMIEKQNIADFTSNLLGLVSFTCFAFLTLKINLMTISELNQFPHFLFLYAFQLVCPALIGFTIFFVNYMRNNTMRETLQRELKNCVDCDSVPCVD
jgi:hypothetical protein